ncbi:MAG: MOSC domain-containing protein [Actinomycetota bacterium]
MTTRADGLPSLGAVVQVNSSRGGVPKLPVADARVLFMGLEGDNHHDRRFHGGPERALCLFSLDVIEALRLEGHPIFPGAAGENITVSGVDWSTVRPGTRWWIGDRVEIEVTGYTTPCEKNAAWFVDGDFTRMGQRQHPGSSRVYARVLSEGQVAAGARFG